MTAQTDNPQSPKSQQRRKAMTTAALTFILIGVIAGIWWLIEARHYESTDDAYVGGNIVALTPQVEGTVVAIHADDTDLVHAGDTLISLDTADTKVALDQAEANLAQTVREVRSLQVTNASLAAGVELRKTQLAKARDDLARRKNLADTGAVSGEEVQHAQNAFEAAETDLLAAREKLATPGAHRQRPHCRKPPGVTCRRPIPRRLPGLAAHPNAGPRHWVCRQTQCPTGPTGTSWRNAAGRGAVETGLG